MGIYKIVIEKPALKELGKLDKPHRDKILKYIDEKIATSSDPRFEGLQLKGNNRSNWRYRVGDYRILAEIKDEVVTIKIVGIDHRK